MLPVPAPSATGLDPGTLRSVQPVSASGSGAAAGASAAAAATSTGGSSGALEAKRQVRVQPSSASAPQAVAA